MAMEKIRVLIVDDHLLFSSGVRVLLEQSDQFIVLGEVADGLEGVKRTESLKPDIVLMDIHMPGISGREALRLIGESAPEAKVVMLTVSEDANDLIECLREGAAGYILKNIAADTLVDALLKIHRGESIISPKMTSRLVRHLQAQQPDEVVIEAQREEMSPREKEVLRGLARGQTNRELAAALGVAESTVKIHIQNIFKKTCLRSRVQAALYAVEHGYADKP
ncbi:response regulator transcription factor [Dechloromonas agitata]|uniref:Response regulator transcription factor n=1 Tax=Dechloromonas agitata TaxID=73030 RepID=A0A930FXX7_9RHOO|nr:response regulator transcription factor [Dechloromonas agitata]MBF1163471.1 response regulator transcription factor [Dechloromonas agitata]MDE1547279.1 response regulator transcription factor [Dechloromonas agitata]